MSRDEAAWYVGVEATKFDEMVADGRMPKPKRVDGRVVRIEAALPICQRKRRLADWTGRCTTAVRFRSGCKMSADNFLRGAFSIATMKNGPD
jgi:excisionase family DNA binding protein